MQKKNTENNQSKEEVTEKRKQTVNVHWKQYGITWLDIFPYELRFDGFELHCDSPLKQTTEERHLSAWVSL